MTAAVSSSRSLSAVPRPLSIALVCTVLNEAAGFDELLGSIEAQTRQPDEVVIVDGGSTDGTWERLVRWEGRGPRRRALRRPGVNISRGRNEAIRASSNTLRGSARK